MSPICLFLFHCLCFWCHTKEAVLWSDVTKILYVVWSRGPVSFFAFGYPVVSAPFIERRRQWHPAPVLLPGKSHGWRSLEGCSPGVAEGRTWLSNFTFIFYFHALEKEMATHSSVLAWRIPGTGELGGLPSMGSHRVGHDWSDLAAT